MAVTQRLDLRQSQSLVMTPQLQQAIKLLELSNVELTQFVEEQIEANPLLEREEEGGRDEGGRADGAPVEGPPEEPGPPAEPPALLDTAAVTAGTVDSPDAAPSDPEYDNLWQSEGGGFERGGGRSDFGEDERSLEETLSRPVDLREHLLEQIRLDIPGAAERGIAVQLLEMLDEAGYLRGDLVELAARLGCPPGAVEAVLAKLQRLDPPGLFARSLAECLAIQLRDRDRLDPAMQALLDNLELLASRDRAQLMRRCGVDAEDLAEMIAEIRALDPKPALAFEVNIATPAVPDILMHRRPDGSWQLELNPETLPRVLVNQSYVARVSKTGDRSTRDFVTERLASANWLVKSLHQRATTILKVASEIVRQQEGFFQHGVAHLRPLIRRDIATAIGMHESTVSRVTTNKYLASPRGLFELRYFFGAAIAGSGGEQHAAEAVRLRIRKLIEAETADGVLSDDTLVAMLRQDGIDIARRTVAKYRESMRIPSSVQRRRERGLEP
ncbi:MAG: RNA polymerase factor sigma-54 [Dongiaceae bacterium]